MDYEKKYKDALKRAKRLHSEPTGGTERIVCEQIFPELKESEDERIRKAIHIYLDWLDGRKDYAPKGEYSIKDMIAWLEKQGEHKPTQETEPFEAEHGKYYYCIKDYFCGGKKQASKGDVIQALRGLPIMSLKDASEYFLPVNFIKCNTTWSEEDERIKKGIIYGLKHLETELEWDFVGDVDILDAYDWLEKQGEQKLNPVLDIEIPFGAKDSELIEASYYIPEGFHAEIEGNNVVIKKGEQKPFDKYEGLTDFERTLADICISWIGEEIGWKQYIKDNADILLKIAIEKFNSIQDVPFEQTEERLSTI